MNTISYLVLATLLIAVIVYFLIVRNRTARARPETDDTVLIAKTPDDEGTAIDDACTDVDCVPINEPAPDDPPTPPLNGQERELISFEIAYAPVARIEGGYQRHPADRGNYNSDGDLVGTNWGIAAFMAEEYFKRTVTEQDMRTLSKAQAKDIYYEMFWRRMYGDQFPTQALADIVFDGFVNHGRWGIRLLQRVLSVTEDGVVGPITMNQLVKADPDEVYVAYLEARRRFYHAIVANRPSQQVFLKGWLKRLAVYETRHLEGEEPYFSGMA